VERARLRKTAERLNAREPAMAALMDAEITAKTAEFRARLAAGETLEDLLTVAINDALRKIEETAQKRMGAVTGGLRIPGMT